MTMPLLVGLDGTQKMSKSYGNYIGVHDSPKDVFGKAMSIPDTLMQSYYDLLTREKFDASMHPRDAKVKLAKILTAELHSPKAADEQASEFTRVFSNKEAPENPEELKIAEKEIWIAELLKRAGAVTSTSEAKRLIEQGAVSIDGQKITDFNLKVPSGRGSLLKAGKKKFVKIV
jgi:tyrosyl-tRNA synthetase